MHTWLLLEMGADAFPDRIAVASPEGGVSLGELAARAKAAANWLAGEEGDKLVFLGLNGWALPVGLFGSGLGGKPFAPLNYRLANDDLNKLLARTSPSVAIVDDDMLGRLEASPGVKLVARSAFEALCLDPKLRAAELPDVQPDVAVILFTSGTTGEPKAAILRHSNLTSYVISTVEFMGAEEDEAILVAMPPYHVAGLAGVLSSVYGGRRIVYLPNFTPQDWVSMAAAERVTNAMVVPTMMGRILDELEKRGERLPALRHLAYGGGRMPQPLIERALADLEHVDFANAYGLTETSSTIAVLGPEDHRQAVASDDPAVRRRLASVGRPLPTLELEIRGPEGEVLPPGSQGEIYVRGDQVAGEYMHRRVIQEDGWFPTNDSGWLDDEGYLFLEGRLDDIIVRGGENISPGEIEDVLRSHPGVADVAVFGLPDDEWGERVAAVIVPAADCPSTEDLSAWVKERLRSTKTPETWDFREALPYNDTGKLLRRILKAELHQATKAGDG
jgi:acyl-CoA synthetase (AMP-forming)/AMP-acid ligase II